jgi:hypothetical protein
MERRTAKTPPRTAKSRHARALLNDGGSPGACAGVVHGADTFPQGLAIESKWQHAQGSVDEKLPYLVSNIREGYHVPAVIVADGGGHRPEALRWLRGQVDGTHLVGVFSLVEFLTWANRAL